LLKVALEKNNEHVQEVNNLVNRSHHSNSQANIMNELRLDNEVSRIISQNVSPNKIDNGNKKNLNSVLHQESTDIATQEYSTRISQKYIGEPDDRHLEKTTSREVILNTHTIHEVSSHNDDLKVVQKPESRQSEGVPPNAEFLGFVKAMLENEIDDDEIINEIEKQVLLENKDFEDELDSLRHDIKQQDQKIRDIKKQKY
jgi:hypothetical protein